jgi:hypothetical protein
MKAHCKIHPDVELICFCPACGGAAKSERKAQAARANGKRGGRPRKPQQDGRATRAPKEDKD